MLLSALGSGDSFGRSNARTGQLQVFLTLAMIAALSSCGMEWPRISKSNFVPLSHAANARANPSTDVTVWPICWSKSSRVISSVGSYETERICAMPSC